MKTKLVQFFSVAMLLACTSCLDEYYVEGNHDLVTENRHARSFEEISSGGDFRVTVVPGAEFKVEVTAESNLQSYIETDVENHVLKIRTRGLYNLHNHKPMEVFVTCPELNGIHLSGSGIVTAEAFTSNDFDVTVSGSGEVIGNIDTHSADVHVSGSGEVSLKGIADETDLSVSGSGKIHTYDLQQQYCKTTISGSGSAYVNVSKTLDVNISGSGKVFFINTPAIHTRISGSGEVVNRN